MASGGNNIVELGINKRKFSSMVYGNQVFCFKPNTKSWIPTKLWSTASVCNVFKLNELPNLR